jgi:hypothetical protein
MNPVGGLPAALDNLTAAAAADFAAAGSTGAIFSSGDGSGPSAATDQAGSSSGTGIFNNIMSNFNFCPTPETVKKNLFKKGNPS